MLLAVPVAVALHISGVSGLWMFLGAGSGIIPLAMLIGMATESLAGRAGAAIGGLLNATFGNAAELIIALVILSRGPALYHVVKATLTGSIIGNLLLVLGASALTGGLRHRQQSFDRTAAGVGATLMTIAAAGLLMPTIYSSLHSQIGAATIAKARVENLSEEIAAVLILIYVLSLIFSLKTHAQPSPVSQGEGGDPARQRTPWPVWIAIAVLFGATIAIAVLSEWLVDVIEPVARSISLNGVFIGVVVVAIIGNAAEHTSAVQLAWQDKLDVSVQIAVTSSTQIALFVAPVLVFASLLMGNTSPLDLHFTRLEVVAVILSVAVVSLVSHDGESNWLEGAMLISLYLILALAFYNLP